MAPSASDLVGALPGLRAFAICLAGDRELADAFVDVALVRAWSGDRHVVGDDVRLLLFNLMHREFHGYEAATAMARLAARPIVQLLPGCDSNRTYVVSLLRGLPAAEREAIVLLYACGFSEVEAAAVCECELGTIRRRARNASQKLSRALHPKRSAGKPVLRLCQVC